MDLNDAKTIVKTLAEGIDPITGESFAPDSPYNRPEIIRALFTLHDLARPPKKAKLSIEEKQRENVACGRPRNAGLPWTDEARQKVASEFAQGTSIKDLASWLERSQGAVHAELIRQGVLEPSFQ